MDSYRPVRYVTADGLNRESEPTSLCSEQRTYVLQCHVLRRSVNKSAGGKSYYLFYLIYFISLLINQHRTPTSLFSRRRPLYSALSHLSSIVSADSFIIYKFLLFIKKCFFINQHVGPTYAQFRCQSADWMKCFHGPQVAQIINN